MPDSSSYATPETASRDGASSTNWKELYRNSLFEIQDREQSLSAWSREVSGVKYQLETLIADRIAYHVADADPIAEQAVLDGLMALELIEQPAQVELLETALRQLRPPPRRDGTSTSLEPISARSSDVGSGKGASSTAADEPGTDTRHAATAELLGLMERLAEVVQAPDEIESLRESLRGEPEPGIIDDCRARLVALVKSRLEGLRAQLDDMGGFLRRTVDNLLAVQGQLVQTGSSLSQGSEHRAALDSAVGDAMAGMKRALVADSGLDQLKSTIETQLGEIDRSLSVFRSQEDQRLREYDRSLAELKARIEQLKRETESLQSDLRSARSQAFRDALTELPNRLACEQFLAAACARHANGGQALSLVLIDIDHFKLINDRFGHPTGDRVLRTVASQLATRLRDSDFIGRFGGEEFMLVTPGHGAAALSVAEKLRAHLQRCTFRHHEDVFPVTISCGVAECLSGDTPESLYARADERLYQAKHGGRNRCAL